MLPLRNGDGIKMTTALYFTPAGRSIQAEGIIPDIVVRPTAAMEADDKRNRESDLDRHLAQTVTETIELPPEQIYVLDREVIEEALNVLQEADLLEGVIENG